MDYISRKRIEELYLITDEILHRDDDINYKYDNKLYQKYKQLKKINKKLQEKIINQHCSGCKCHNQLNEDTEESTSKYSDKRTECSSDDEEQIDTNQTVSKTNDPMAEEEEEDLSDLPLLLQDIIKNKVKENKTDNKYLLEIGLHPAICKLLCNTSVDSLKTREIQQAIRPFISKNIKTTRTTYMKILFHITNEIRDIHQSYLLQFNKAQQKEENKTNRKKEAQRKSL